VKIASFKDYARSGVRRRIDALQKAAAKLDARFPEGMNEEEAKKCFEHFKPYFGSIDLERGHGEWDLVVYHHVCTACRNEFDEYDLAGTICADGRLRCPRCGHEVVPQAPAPPAAALGLAPDAEGGKA
jgi:DNA-directed RNA polymerase subunit RPC12/RpoP